MTEAKTKEIGIRRVLGAPISGIIFLLSRDFLKWVMLANLAALPLAYFILNQWLQKFAFRIDIGVWIFDILTRRWPSMSLKVSFKETVGLDSHDVNNYVKQVMSIPEQVLWYKRFIRTTCPMSSRTAGLNNDLDQLESVSFGNLDEIMCPTMVVHGTVDTDVSFSNAEFSANSIPNARLYRLENVGHLVWLGEHVSKMNSDILEFLRKSM